MDVFNVIGILSALDSMLAVAEHNLSNSAKSEKIGRRSGRTMGEQIAEMRRICQETGATLHDEYNGRGRNF